MVYIESIRDGIAVMHLSPDMCQQLAQACEVASDHLGSIEETALRQCIEALGATFKAAAIAGYTQWWMPVRTLENLDEDLVAMGLQREVATENCC